MPKDRGHAERLRKDEAENPLQVYRHAHILGPTSSNMAGMAEALREAGSTVTTSDVLSVTDEPLLRSQSRPRSRLPLVLPKRATILLHGSDVPRHNPVRLAAIRRSVPQRTPSELLALAMRSRIGIVVAGGRLAGVAAAMIGWILTHSGKDPTVILERPSRQIGGCARIGSGAHFIAEWSGDLGDLAGIKPCMTLFLDPVIEQPAGFAAETGVSRDDVVRFRKQSETGIVLALGHPSRLQDVDSDHPSWVDPLGSPFETFSLRRGSSWWGTDLRLDSVGPRFRIFHKGDFVIEVALRVRGIRGILGALAAVSACRALGLSTMEIGRALEDFQGTAHDFEVRGTFRGVSLVNDPSEHPSAIEESLRLARQLFKNRRLWAVLELPMLDPDAIQSFEQALADSDRVILVGPPRWNQTPRFDGLESRLLKNLNGDDREPKAKHVSDVHQSIQELDKNLEPGDVLLALGNGEVGTIADVFIRRLSRDRQDG